MLHRKKTRFVLLSVLVVLSTSVAALAQGNGAAGMAAATAQVRSFFEPALNLMMIVGAVLAVPGALYVYTKFQNQDPNFKAALTTYVGSMIFLVVAPFIIRGFFL